MPLRSVIRVKISADMPIDRKDLSAYGTANEAVKTAADEVAAALGLKLEDLTVEATPTNIRD